MCTHTVNMVWRTFRKLHFTSTSLITTLVEDSRWSSWRELRGSEELILIGIVELAEDLADNEVEHRVDGPVAMNAATFNAAREVLDLLHQFRLVDARRGLCHALAAVAGAALDEASLAELRDAAKTMKIKKIPSEEASLREAIRVARNVKPTSLGSVLTKLSEASFQGNRATRAGVMLEPKVRGLLSSALAPMAKRWAETECVDNPFAFCRVAGSTGLRESSASGFMLSTDDGRILFSSDAAPTDAGMIQVASLEIKCFSGDGPLAKARDFAAKHGKYTEVDLFKSMSGATRKLALDACVGDGAYLLQTLQHCAVNQTESVLFVRADAHGGGILGVTRLMWSLELREDHLKTLDLIGRAHMPWVIHPMTVDPPEDGPHAREDHRRMSSLRACVRRMAPIVGELLSFKPAAVAYHNRLKVVTDVMHAQTIDLRVDVGQWRPRMVFFAEMSLIAGLGATRLFRAFRVAQAVNFDVQKLAGVSAKKLQRRMNEVGSSVSLLRGAARRLGDSVVRDVVNAPAPPQTSADRAARSIEARAQMEDVNQYFKPTSAEWWEAIAALKLSVNKGGVAAKPWSSDPLLTALRLNTVPGSLEHTKLLSNRRDRRNCVLSCTHCEKFTTDGTEHPGKREAGLRDGFRTSVYCGSCEVYLSDEPRASLGGRDAFTVWHTERVLPAHPFVVDVAEAAELLVRSRPSTSTNSGKKARKTRYHRSEHTEEHEKFRQFDPNE